MGGTRSPEELRGLGVSPGVAVGRAVCIETHGVDIYRFPLPAAAVEAEVERLFDAVARAEEELEETLAQARGRLGDELAGIFQAQSLLLADRALLQQIAARIREEEVNAEWAVHKVVEDLRERFEALESDRFRERGEDLVDVSRLLLRSLQGVAHHQLSELGSEVIIISHDLTPSEAVRLGRQHVVAFAVETGGPTSHTSIIARDLNIPLVTGVTGVTARVTDNDPVIVDGVQGLVILHPSAEQIAGYRRQRRSLRAEDERLFATGDLPAVSRDGVPIDLMANIDLPEEIGEAAALGAVGIGLYRSEFLYIERAPQLPTEEEHLRTYRQLLDSMAPHPVVIRTFDLGGRKLAREVLDTEEDNPVLGLRGIRLTLARPEIFKTQLRALLRAAEGRDNLWILLPMISGFEEVRAFRSVLDEVALELERKGVGQGRVFRLGAMIEVPSAAMTADILAREVDFFSIGTNDLIQYSLAIDRGNEHVSYLHHPLHPAILRMIRFVIDSAAAQGLDVSICGEMAGSDLHTGLLLGMGLRRLSVAPRRIPAVKARIRELDLSALSGLAERCLEASSADEVRELLERPIG